MSILGNTSGKISSASNSPFIPIVTVAIKLTIATPYKGRRSLVAADSSMSPLKTSDGTNPWANIYEPPVTINTAAKIHK